jgi:hypothetical protein
MTSLGSRTLEWSLQHVADRKRQRWNRQRVTPSVSLLPECVKAIVFRAACGALTKVPRSFVIHRQRSPPTSTTLFSRPSPATAPHPPTRKVKVLHAIFILCSSFACTARACSYQSIATTSPPTSLQYIISHETHPKSSQSSQPSTRINRNHEHRSEEAYHEGKRVLRWHRGNDTNGAIGVRRVHG